MDYSTPGFPVLHHLPEFAQTHVHWLDDAIQLSHPLSPPSPPALNLSHPGLISFRIDWFDLLVVQWAFRYFNVSVPPSRAFWFGKKKNSIIVSCIWPVSYWRYGCGQDHQILLGLWGGACTHRISFVDNYLLKVCPLNTLHSSDTKLLCWLYTKVGLWNFVQFFALSFFTPLTPA